MKTVFDVVHSYIQNNRYKYDGLVNDALECGCDIDDLMPCSDQDIARCELGYKCNCTDKGEEWNYVIKPGEKVEE